MGGVKKGSKTVDKVAQLAAVLRADGEPSTKSNSVPQLLACMRDDNLKVAFALYLSYPVCCCSVAVLGWAVFVHTAGHHCTGESVAGFYLSTAQLF